MNTIWILVIITQAGSVVVRSPAMEFRSLERCNAALERVRDYRAQAPDHQPYAMQCVKVDLT